MTILIFDKVLKQFFFDTRFVKIFVIKVVYKFKKSTLNKKMDF